LEAEKHGRERSDSGRTDALPAVGGGESGFIAGGAEAVAGFLRKAA